MGEKTLKERTANGLAWGALNNLMTQLLATLIGIVLGRLLSPGEYGMVGMLAIFSAVASTLQESGFTAALTNLKQATHREYNAVFWFSTTVSVSLYLLFFVSAPLIADYFRQPQLVALSRLLFLSFVVAGIGTAHAAYMFRNMMNREKAVTGLLALVGSGAVSITLALNGYSYWSLAWQQLTYITLVNIGRLYYVRWRPSLHMDLTPIREMFGFSSKLLVTNIVNQVNNNLLSFIFGRLFNAGVVGNYTQAAKWNNMGHSLITGTMQQVAQPVLASINDDEGRQLNVFRKMMRFTAFLSMPAMLGLALIADFVVVLLGEQWRDSVPLLRMLCISGAFMPIQSLCQNLIISHGRSDTYMWGTLLQIIIQISVTWAFSSWGIQAIVCAYTVMMVVWVLVWLFMAGRQVGLTCMHAAQDILPFLVTACLCIGVAGVCTWEVSQPVLSILLRMVITALLYVLVMKVARVSIYEECVDYLLGKIRLRR